MRVLYVCDKLITFILNEIIELKNKGYDILILSEDSRRIHDIITAPILAENGLDGKYYRLSSFKNRKEKYVCFVKSFISDLFYHPIYAVRAFIYIFLNYSGPKYGIVDYLDIRDFLNSGVDIIHSPFSTPRVMDKVYLLSRILNIPFTLCFRAHDIYHNDNFNEVTKRINVINKASEIITIADYNRQYIKNRVDIDKYIEIVHSSINPELFRPQNLERRHNSIISVCRLDDQKGLVYLINACHILNKRKIDYECTIIGEGPEKTEYEKLIDELQIPNIKFIDFLSYDGIKEHLNLSTVFVLPCVISPDGKRDILANSLKEAMAMEMPVITTAICGIQELVDDGVNGILVPPHDAESIADAIEKIFKNPERRYEMGKAGREKIERDFNAKIEVSKLEKLFKKAVMQMCTVNEDKLLDNSGKKEPCLQGKNKCL